MRQIRRIDRTFDVGSAMSDRSRKSCGYRRLSTKTTITSARRPMRSCGRQYSGLSIRRPSVGRRHARDSAAMTRPVLDVLDVSLRLTQFQYRTSRSAKLGNASPKPLFANDALISWLRRLARHNSRQPQRNFRDVGNCNQRGKQRDQPRQYRHCSALNRQFRHPRQNEQHHAERRM